MKIFILGSTFNFQLSVQLHQWWFGFLFSFLYPVKNFAAAAAFEVWSACMMHVRYVRSNFDPSKIIQNVKKSVQRPTNPLALLRSLSITTLQPIYRLAIKTMTKSAAQIVFCVWTIYHYRVWSVRKVSSLSAEISSFILVCPFLDYRATWACHCRSLFQTYSAEILNTPSEIVQKTFDVEKDY